MSGRRQMCRIAAPPSGRRDSNPRPSPWQGDALPAEPRPHASPEYSPGHPPDLSGAASELYPILAQPPTQNPRLEKKSASLTIRGYSSPTITAGQPPTRAPASPAHRRAACPGSGRQSPRRWDVYRANCCDYVAGAEGLDGGTSPGPLRGHGPGSWFACYAWRSRSVSSAPTSTKSLSPPSGTMA